MKIYHLRKEHVYMRADERGYSRESVEPCFIKEIGNGWWQVDVEHAKYPHADKTKPVPITVEQVPLGTKLVSGAVGITKWLAGMDKATKELAESRLAVCDGCPHLHKGLIGTCGICSCKLSIKTALVSEHCPIKKW